VGLLNALLDLFVEFLKIGFLMFGGAYSGVALMHKELVELKGWLTNEEFIDVVGISQSAPGPVTINLAVLIGYRICGILGSVVATLGIVLPAYLIVLGIAAGLSPYLTTPLARTILRGINCAVVALVLIVLLTISQKVLIQDNTVGLVEVVIFVTAFTLVFLFKQHPVAAIGVSIVLSLIAKYVFGF